MTLPSWCDGEARRRILAFLDDAASVPEDQRVAVLDNDGTLWCERPNYAQVDFMVALLREAAGQDPGLRDRAEYAAVLSNDRAELARLGLPRVALALAELCRGLEPEGFNARVEDFMATARHPTLGVTYDRTVYHPMVELLDALRGSGFRVFVVTGGGTEFVRAISRRLYDVPPECVIGTRVRYDLGRPAGRPTLLRTASLDGKPNEGAVKIENIQRHIGQRPLLAAGNSAGDLEMLDYTASEVGLGLALIVDHDDDEREFAYEGEGVTVSIDRPLADVAREKDWVVVSMRRDWSTVFSTG